MEIIGRILKENRIRKNLTVHEIAVVTKINSRIIKAIEEGNLNELPSKSFLRGFIRSYASYLKLDVDEILKTFQEELGSTLYHPSKKRKPKKENTSTKSKSKKSFFKFSLRTCLFLTTLVIFLVFSLISIKSLVEKYKNESQVNLSPQVLKNVQNLKLKEEKNKDETNNLKKEPKQNVLIQKDKIKPQEISALSVDSNHLPLLTATQNPWHELILEASRKVELQLKNIVNQKTLNLTLLKERPVVLKFKDSLQLYSNQPRSINIIYNGKNQGKLLKKINLFEINKVKKQNTNSNSN